MKRVTVNPELCIGCKRCVKACAMAHARPFKHGAPRNGPAARSATLNTGVAAVLNEAVKSTAPPLETVATHPHPPHTTPHRVPRVHVGRGRKNRGFPHRCRHCDPAPCILACLPGAMYRDEATGSVLVDFDRCINCASCAMACPYGVISFDTDHLAPPGKTVALKCDNCLPRQAAGLPPACVEVCETGALVLVEYAGRESNRAPQTADDVEAGYAADVETGRET